MTTYAHDTLTQKQVDAADLWSTDADYGSNEQFSVVVPPTPALTTLDGIDLTPGRQVNLAYPVARTAAETAATFDAAEALLVNYVGEAAADSGSALQEFEDLSEVDSATFRHGEQILIRSSEFGPAQHWVFTQNATEGGYGISDVSNGYLDLLGDRLFEWPLVADGGVEPAPLNFRQANIGAGGYGDTDRPYGFEQFHIRRHADSTAQLPTDLLYEGQPWTIAADDFDTWLVERRGDDEYTVVGELGAGATPSVVPGGVLGSYVHAVGNATQGLYEVNGSTYTDAVLAAHLTANPVTGFVVAGSAITTPDWRGRALMSSGALGITGPPGTLYSDQNKSHRHIGGKSVFGAEAAFGTTTADGGGGNDGASNWDSANANKPFTSTEGGDEARPNAVSMPICIVGSVASTEPDLDAAWPALGASDEIATGRVSPINGKPVVRGRFNRVPVTSGGSASILPAGTVDTVEHYLNLTLRTADDDGQYPLPWSDGGNHMSWVVLGGAMTVATTWTGGGASSVSGFVEYTKL